MAKISIYYDKNSGRKDEHISQVSHSSVENGVLSMVLFNGEKRERKLDPSTVKVKVLTEKTLFKNEELLNSFKKNKEEQPVAQQQEQEPQTENTPVKETQQVVEEEEVEQQA